MRYTPNEAGEGTPAWLGTNAKDVFNKIEEHLLIVSRAAASLVDAGTCPVVRSARITSQRLSEFTSPTRNERKALLRRKLDVRLLVVASALLIALGLGFFAGWVLYDCVLRREPKLAHEIITRFVARNILILRQRRLPVTAGTVYLTHFAGAAGAVAILSAPDNSDAALVLANADSTGRTKRERLIKANTILEHFTVADLKAWADRKMGGPNLRLVEELVAETRP